MTSTIETILSRAMSEPAFADALFADADTALAEYNLPAEVLAHFKQMSRAEFEAMEAEDRKSMSVLLGAIKQGGNAYQHKHIGGVKYED